MPVINGVYLKDFTALPSSVTDANIIPIAITGDQVAYRTTVAGIVTDARITSKLLTGLSVTGATILATDTILQAFGKVQNQLNGKVTSVGLTMPSAFNVANSPITSAGTLAVTAAGVASQYIRGDGALGDFPTTGGGGSSVSYYLNGSVSQGTFVGNTYYEMNKTPVIGAGTDFTIGADGYIAQFITDANDPASLLIPAGNWNVEMYFSASSNGGTPSFYVEVYKYNGTTFTLLGTSSATPEGITNGTAIDIYYTSVGIPETVLTITDRLAIRVYVTHSGRTITLHTEDNHLSEIVTTFSNGLTTLNGLTKQAQYFAVGSTGTDFNIASSIDTHTFNIPSASASNRGLITTGSQTIAGDKNFTGIINALAIQSNQTSGYAIFTNSITNGFGGYFGVSGTGSHSIYAGAVSGNSIQARNNSSTYETINVINDGSGNIATFGNSSGTKLTVSNLGGLTGTTANFTGQLTLGSTITNGTYTYTLPSATGTLALVGGAGVGTVTSVAAITLGTTGTDLSSTVATGTTTPVITLQVPTASAANRGALSSADWSTFNSKQGTITLTTTGTSGAATFSGNTLNIPNYADGGVLSLSAIGGTANANGATITGTVLNLQPASASFGGVITTGTQTFAGDKTLTGTLYGIGLSMTGTTADIVQGTATSGKALRGTATTGWGLYASATTGVGVQGNSSGTGGSGVFGSSGDGYGGVFYNDSTTYAALEVNNNNESAGNIAVFRRVGTSVFIINGLGNISNGTYTYTLPSATGTLALTSALSSYLPLSGGTLTGALSGTSATFSGDLTIDTNTLYVDSTNNRVGIGTTTPAYKFETLGTSVITAAFGRSDYGASNVMLIAMNGFRDIYKQAIGVVRTGDYDKGDMIFCLNGSANSTVVSASDERMRITSGGNIAFNSVVYNNTTTATTRTLFIGGDYGIGGISSIRASKKNIENIYSIDWLYNLNTVTFNYRKKDEDGSYTEEIYEEVNYGLIAEDTAPIADFLINYNDKEDGTKEMIGIEYSRLISPMLKAIQELKAEIDLLKGEPIIPTDNNLE